MQSIEALLETLKKNDEITKKFQAIETKILSILDFTALFEILLGEIRQKFQVPYVWLTFIEADDNTDLLQFIKHSKILETNLNIVPQETFFSLIPEGTRPLLVNDDLKPFYRLLPPIKKFLAFHDPLTGILNRRVMESILKREFQRSGRYNCPLSLVFLDIDYFKKINDQFGHDMGDRVLVHLAHGIDAMVRNSDVVARFAGDEFVVILPETTAKKADTNLYKMKAKRKNAEHRTSAIE